MFNYLITPTPQQLLGLMIFCVPIFGIMIYFVSGIVETIISLFLGLGFIGFAYQIQQNEKVRDKSDITFERFMLAFIIPIIVISFHLWTHEFFDREDFVTNKHQLNQVSGIIPEKYTYIYAKKGPSTYYLTIDNTRFNCAENRQDYCKNIYKYAGKKATVYYQANAKNGHLAYEIVVHDTIPFVIYNFESQLKEFNRVRKKENIQFLSFSVLLCSMCFLFLFWSRHSADDVEEMNDEEKAEFDKKLEEKSNKEYYPTFKDFGFVGSVFYVIGLFGIVISCIAGLICLLMQNMKWLLTFIIIFMTSLLIVRKTEQLANRKFNARLNINNKNKGDTY